MQMESVSTEFSGSVPIMSESALCLQIWCVRESDVQWNSVGDSQPSLIRNIITDHTQYICNIINNINFIISYNLWLDWCSKIIICMVCLLGDNNHNSWIWCVEISKLWILLCSTLLFSPDTLEPSKTGCFFIIIIIFNL